MNIVLFNDGENNPSTIEEKQQRIAEIKQFLKNKKILRTKKEVYLALGQGKTVTHLDCYDVERGIWFGDDGELYESHTRIDFLTIYPEELENNKYYLKK